MRAISWVVVLVGITPVLADSPRGGGPRTPQEELSTFQLQPGFKIELVASEPQIMDPVAAAFDAEGRLYVAEMRGYPNEGFGTGNIRSGCIKLLRDKDGDGVYETATIFADGLRFPTSIQPWRKGILVSVAPDLIYLEDTDHDGRADVRRTIYTGFGIDNIQQLLNSVQWGLDNWVYACNGASGGTIRSIEQPKMPPLSLGNRGIRFKPDEPGSLEAMSGGGQFGLSPDAFQHWFTATNSQHLRQIILPDHYLRRNPGLTVATTTLDIPEHGAACRVFRISEFEAWRVERTQRRATGPDAGRFAKTELVPGGFVTSACSPVVLEHGLAPTAAPDSVLICEPANNLVLQDVLVETGPIFSARRVNAEREFLASRDNWFRPVNLHLGPDGAIYLVDFYREVIETPRSLPDDMKAKLTLKTQERGRLWRILPPGAKRVPPPNLAKMASEDLVPLLADGNRWIRLTAQRLIVERKDRTVALAVEKLFRSTPSAPGRAHALWTLDALGSLTDEIVMAALTDSSTGVREQALRLSEGRISGSPGMLRQVAKLADDPAPRVRFQAAFSLGASEAPEAAAALAHLLRQDADDPWITSAVLSSARHASPAMLAKLSSDPAWTNTAQGQTLGGRLALMIGSRAQESDLLGVLRLLDPHPKTGWDAFQRTVLDGLAQGMQNSPRPLARLWDDPSPSLRAAAVTLEPGFQRIGDSITASDLPLNQSLVGIKLLGHAPSRLAVTVLGKLLSPRSPVEVQLAAIRALAVQTDPQVAPLLLGAWAEAGPAAGREIQEALFARPARIPALLDALETKTVRPQQIDAARISQLQKLPDQALRARASKLLAGAIDADRQKVLDLFKPTLDLKPDVEKGRMVFRKICATCHRLENVGTEVGPDLRAALRDKTADQLLVSILDPSREVDRRFTNYLVETKSGRTLTGLIAAETATSITLRRAEKAEDVILRAQLESITDTGKSLMPDGLEKDLRPQDIADLIGYLRAVK